MNSFKKNKRWIIRNLAIPISVFLILMIITRQQWLASFVLAFLVFLFFRKDYYIKSQFTDKSTEFDFLMQESTFSNYLIRLLGYLVHVDGTKSRSEITFIRKQLLEHYPEEKVEKIIAFISKTSDRKNYPIKTVCRMIRVEFNTASKVQLMYLLIGICTADGELGIREEELLKQIAIHIRLPYETYSALLEMFHFNHESKQKKRQKERNKRKVKRSDLSLSKAYKVLGIKPEATVKQIKKAYRKLVMLHHPDRVSEEFKKSAEEKFQKIDEAYDFIKEKRAFK